MLLRAMMSGMSKDRTCALTRGVGGNRQQREASHREKGWEWDHEVVASIILALVP